jgi:hypothetical protein
MGQHAWLLTATICTELLCIVKWSKGQFNDPFPTHIKWMLGLGISMLVFYPITRVSISLVFHLTKPDGRPVWRAKGSTIYQTTLESGKAQSALIQFCLLPSAYNDSLHNTIS